MIFPPVQAEPIDPHGSINRFFSAEMHGHFIFILDRPRRRTAVILYDDYTLEKKIFKVTVSHNSPPPAVPGSV